jgi:hypothetical protein
MSEREFGTPTPYVEHVPDEGPAGTHPRPDTVERGAGFIELGFLVDGVKVRLARVKAGGVFDDLRRADEQAKSEQQSQTSG